MKLTLEYLQSIVIYQPTQHNQNDSSDILSSSPPLQGSNSSGPPPIRASTSSSLVQSSTSSQQQTSTPRSAGIGDKDPSSPRSMSSPRRGEEIQNSNQNISQSSSNSNTINSNPQQSGSSSSLTGVNIVGPINTNSSSGIGGTVGTGSNTSGVSSIVSSTNTSVPPSSATSTSSNPNPPSSTPSPIVGPLSTSSTPTSSRQPPSSSRLYDYVYTEEGYRCIQNWFLDCSSIEEFLIPSINENKFLEIFRQLTSFHDHEILEIYDFLEDEKGGIQFENIFLLIAMYCAMISSKLTCFLYNHVKTVYQLSKPTHDTQTLTFEKFTRFGFIIGIREKLILKTLESLGADFHHLNEDVFTMCYFTLLDDMDKGDKLGDRNSHLDQGKNKKYCRPM